LITAVDSSVLFDLLIPGAPHMEKSRALLDDAADSGSLVISEAALAELSARFEREPALKSFLADSDIALNESEPTTLFRAGHAWRDYARRRSDRFVCSSCGTRQAIRCHQCNARLQSRQHVLADFLIGAHALLQADQLLTRDRGYYKTYFPELRLSDTE